MVWSIIGSIIVGAIVGVIARLVRPGRQNVSMLETVGIGVVSAFIVGLVLGLTAYKEKNSGIPWIAWILSIVVAVILIPVYEQLRGRAKS